MSDEAMKIAVLGAGGRMGQALTRAVVDTPGCTLAGGVERAGSDFIGKDLGSLAGLEPLGVTVTDNPVPLFAEVQAVLDFTTPEATVEFAALSAQARIVHVIGTTGLTDQDQGALKAASRHAAIIRAGNMSMGVNLLTSLTEKVAKALDESFDIEISELHHRHKQDAPSGTALMLGEAAAKARGVSLKDKAVFAREGQTGARREGDIGFSCMRGGDVVGEHKIVFVGPGERIELGHVATDRGIFSRGAVKAALWGRDKPPGLYSMADVLGL